MESYENTPIIPKMTGNEEKRNKAQMGQIENNKLVDLNSYINLLLH